MHFDARVWFVGVHAGLLIRSLLGLLGCEHHVVSLVLQVVSV